MYEDLFIQFDPSGAKLVLPQKHDPALSHIGDHTRPLHLHTHDVAAAFMLDGLRGLRVLDPLLFKRIADTRMLKTACDDLRRGGPKAAGPDGRHLEELTGQDTWSLCKALSTGMKNGTYRPGPSRVAPIPKPGKPNEFRRLTIQNGSDRIVARSVLLILQPIVEHLLSPFSYAFRPSRSRVTALAAASVIARGQYRWVWVKEDVEKAFDRIPFGRLLSSLATQFPAEVTALLRKIASTGKKLGIRQGSPLSPMLFNLYLELTVGRIWTRRHPQIPLIRYADDLLLLCRDRAEAADAHQELSQLARSAGIPFKKTPGNGAVDLDGGEAISWLGYWITKANQTLRVTIGEPSWSKLALALEAAHTKPESPIRAAAAVRGWLEQLGPCFPSEPTSQTLVRVRLLAAQHAFEELPSKRTLSRDWQRGHQRFLNEVEKQTACLAENLERAVSLSSHTPCCGTGVGLPSPAAS